MIVKDPKFAGKSGYAIIVNGNHPEYRQRFTIAREIGIIVLYGNLINKDIVDDGLYRFKFHGEPFIRFIRNRIDINANEFANNLLMPFPLIKKLMDSGITALPELAKKLKVSEPMLAVRLGVPAQSFERESEETRKPFQLNANRM